MIEFDYKLGIFSGLVSSFLAALFTVINGKLIKKRYLMRTVLITGVSTGIGKSIAEQLLENKFYVIGSVRKKKDAKFLINTSVLSLRFCGLILS